MGKKDVTAKAYLAAADRIAVMSKTKELKNIKKNTAREEGFDMCRAIDLMIADGEKRGIECGIDLARKVFVLYLKGTKREEIARMLNISLEKVKHILDGNA